MTTLTPEQSTDPKVKDARREFMKSVLFVSLEDLKSLPQPPGVKRGRRHSLKTASV